MYWLSTRSSCCVIIQTVGCKDPNEAINFWRSYLSGFATEQWGQPPWEMQTDGSYQEDFAFLHDNIVFASINLVGRGSQNEQDYEDVTYDQLKWIDEVYTSNRRKISTFVLFMHAGPEDNTNREFFNDLFERIQSQYGEARFVIVCRSENDKNYGMRKDYRGIKDLYLISVLGPVWPPLQITLDTRPEAIELVTIDFDRWFNDLI